MLKRIEFTSGLAAGVCGFLGWAYAVFGPTYHYVRSAVDSQGRGHTVSGSTSLAHNGLTPQAMVFFVVVVLALIGVASGAYVHSRGGSRPGLALLWTATPLLWIWVVLGAASIGVLLLPAALLAAVAAVTGSLAQARQ
jgi:hypothetical protein